MNIKGLILTVLETIVKVVILAFAIMYILKGISAAYEFGYKVFADEPMSANNGRTITVGIAESATVDDVGKMLEDKGLIKDAKLFKIQEYLSSYHDQIKPGIYDLSTSMNTAEILEVISSGEDLEEDADAPSEDNVVSDSGETEEGTDAGAEEIGSDDSGVEEPAAE